MLETVRKYELLALLPLTATDDELKAQASGIEDNIRSAGGTVAGGNSLQKGRIAYPVRKVSQGYYHLIQFEMDPRAVAAFKRSLLLAGKTLRFTLTGAGSEFKTFVPSAPRPAPGRRTARAPAAEFKPVGIRNSGSDSAAKPAKFGMPAEPLIQATPAMEDQSAEKPPAKITMEELDKKLEEILGK